MINNFDEDDDEDDYWNDLEINSCLFSAIYKFNKKEDGFFFEGTILSFLLSSDQFWENSLDHGRELKKAQGFSVPTLSETDRKTILDHWKTEKWAKLQILWKILLKQHSCPESGCLKPQLDNSSRMNYYQAKDSEELENIFKIRPKINETNKNQDYLVRLAQARRWTQPLPVQSPTAPTLRANPYPKVTDPICRLPLPTLFYRPEAVHLGDLLRIWVRAGVSPP